MNCSVQQCITQPVAHQSSSMLCFASAASGYCPYTIIIMTHWFCELSVLQTCRYCEGGLAVFLCCKPFKHQADCPKHCCVERHNMQGVSSSAARCAAVADTVNSLCKDTQCKDNLDVRTMSLLTKHCILTAVVSLSTDNLV